MDFKADQQFAESQDQNDPLRDFRKQFFIPIMENREVIYLSGNSLGLQPVNANPFLQEELTTWRELGVDGHHQGARPWIDYHQQSKESLGRLTGAKTHEVVSMNSLTVNLHLLLAAFYQPDNIRKKIIIEDKAFPSDYYAVLSQLAKNKVDAADLIILKPKNGLTYHTEEICEAIESAGDELALILFPGIQYYTGQFFDMGAITAAAHRVGAYAGFDLAHAIGNVPLHLHEQGVDFATWCSYKYLNSGPGGVSGIFVHENHTKDRLLPTYTGWWGHHPATRFQMDNEWDPAPGVDAWQLSNVNVLSTAVHLAALALFDQAGIEALRRKSMLLTGWLANLLENGGLAKEVTIITPVDPEERGCQLSLQIKNNGEEIAHQLKSRGIVVDWRAPDVIRVAPVPLYNTFTDVWTFYTTLNELIVEA